MQSSRIVSIQERKSAEGEKGKQKINRGVVPPAPRAQQEKLGWQKLGTSNKSK
jgi:hypothetical protein